MDNGEIEHSLEASVLQDYFFWVPFPILGIDFILNILQCSVTTVLANIGDGDSIFF